jgi:hypothetical protein
MYRIRAWHPTMLKRDNYVENSTKYVYTVLYTVEVRTMKRTDTESPLE